METIRVAVPRKGRPLETVLERFVPHGYSETIDEIISTLRYEKAIAKGYQSPPDTIYRRLDRYSSAEEPGSPEYTLFRDHRPGFPRRIVFDSVSFEVADREIQLLGREEPLQALRKHEFALGFDSADLVLENVVTLEPNPLTELTAVNDRIDPVDTDVRILSGMGDVVQHTLLATPEVCGSATLDRSFVDSYTGPLCISPRYERLVEAILGTVTVSDIGFSYPTEGTSEEEAVAETGIGVYLTMTGSTARDHGLVVGEELFPSETVLLANTAELDNSQTDIISVLTTEGSRIQSIH